MSFSGPVSCTMLIPSLRSVKPRLILTSAVSITLVGCSRPQTSQAPPPGPTVTPATVEQDQQPTQPVDACSLLTSEEIESVQREAVTGTTPSGGTLGGFPSTQCVFMTVTPVNSVSVVITQSAPKASHGVREFWEQTFHRKADEDRPGGETEGDEEGEKKAPPQGVPELGDEAFWMGTQISTALYVLKGDSYIRISVGGAGDQAVKLEKSRKLAEFALKRL